MIAGVTEKQITDVERAKEYVSRQFTTDEKWATLSDAIFARMESEEQRAFSLADVDDISKAVSCTADDTLSLLALLSRPDAHILRLEFRSNAPDATEVPASELVRMLTAWWRTKSISDDEWKQWASRVLVRWVPVNEGVLA